MSSSRIMFSAAGLGLLAMLTHAASARAAEIEVLSTIGVRSVMQELGPQFERMTGHKLGLTYDVANALKRKIEAGYSFDVAILTEAVTDDLIKQRRILAVTRTFIARAGNGLAVRAGAPKPDISSVDAFKRALLGARSIAYSRDGASGIYFGQLIERLGIAESLKGRARRVEGNVAELVARGEVEMAVQLVPELIAVNGVELAGPFPREVQNYIVFVAGIGAVAKEPSAGRRLIKYLTGPEAVRVIRAKAMEPR